MKSVAVALSRFLLLWLVRLLFGVGQVPRAALPRGPFVLFANHQSHVDTLVVWASLPSEVRSRFRPIAAYDYWGKSALRRFIAVEVLRAALIRRDGSKTKDDDPISQMLAELDSGESILLFPEGTRARAETVSAGASPAQVVAFRSGLFNLWTARATIPFVPVFLDNPGRVLPKGEFVPVPFLCCVRIAAPLSLPAETTREVFLSTARGALLQLGCGAPEEQRSTP